MEDAVSWKSFATVFSAVFLAELGDKTQLAALSFSAAGHRPWVVFGASVAALAAVTGIGVLFGGFLTRVVSPETLQRGAAVLFILIGIWMLWKG